MTVWVRTNYWLFRKAVTGFSSFAISFSMYTIYQGTRLTPQTRCVSRQSWVSNCTVEYSAEPHSMFDEKKNIAVIVFIHRKIEINSDYRNYYCQTYRAHSIQIVYSTVVKKSNFFVSRPLNDISRYWWQSIEYICRIDGLQWSEFKRVETTNQSYLCRSFVLKFTTVIVWQSRGLKVIRSMYTPVKWTCTVSRVSDQRSRFVLWIGSIAEQWKWNKMPKNDIFFLVFVHRPS